LGSDHQGGEPGVVLRPFALVAQASGKLVENQEAAICA
jgi:hypothetical protein